MSTTADHPDWEAERRISEAARDRTWQLDLSDLGLTMIPDSTGKLRNLTKLELGATT